MNTPYRFGRFELHPATRQLLADGGAVTLGARAFDVLVALVERRERLVTKDELLEIAWPGLVVEENNLQVQISALRKALGPQSIATIPGRGYRFALRLEGDAAPVTEHRADAPERRKDPRPWLVPSQSEGPRLAAVVITDVVGYSSRMQKDESGTMALVRADFERMRGLCGQHGGESLNTMGDGLLLCFPSALQAVSCALQIQSEFGARKASLPPEQALDHRIGVHLGDVFHLDTGDVAGDGINIASRLESKAPPGGICLSQTIYDTVKGKLPMRARFAGPETFKNIAEPVLIWQVMPESAPEPAPEPAKTASPAEATPAPRRRPMRWIVGAVAATAVLAIAGGWYWTQRPTPVSTVAVKPDAAAADAKSVAVLPFTNMSEEKDTAFFADGVHEDLLTQLALLSDVRVVSRTSVMDYRNTKKNMRQIGTELGVGSLVEGSVRRAGNHVRVSAQLIDARSDKHLWAKSYDRELKDIFAIQAELATEIAKALKISLAPQEQTRLARRPTDNLEAYDFFLRHQELVNRSTGTVRIMSTVKERIALLARAVELDPKFALAWARLAAEHARAYKFGIDRGPGRQAQAREAIDRALALAPADVQVEIEAATYYQNALNDPGRAATSFERILKAAPNNVESLVGLADAYFRQLRIADEVALLERAFTVDGRNASVLIRLANNYRNHRHFDRSLALRQQLINLRPDDLDLQATYQLNEYWRTGSWESYDRWRSTLPKDAELKSARVMFADVHRAAARHDFAEALRLMDLDPEDTKSLMDASATADRHADRTIALRAKGDRTEAEKAARNALRQIESELRRAPENDSMWLSKSRMHAVLDERNAAFSAHARAVAVAERNLGKGIAEFTYRQILQLHALLGDRKEALAELARQLNLPDSWPHHFRVDIELALLWDDPQFQAIVNDPKNNAPLPIVNRDSPWLGK
jgi:TolB-like protein/class 3 adenylate cyclase